MNFPRNYWEFPDPLGLDADSAEDDRAHCAHGLLEGDCDVCVQAASDAAIERQTRLVEDVRALATESLTNKTEAAR